MFRKNHIKKQKADLDADVHIPQIQKGAAVTRGCSLLKKDRDCREKNVFPTVVSRQKFGKPVDIVASCR